MEKFKVKVINLFGGACVGKTATASDLFSLMRKKRINCTLGTEYAKKLVYEENMDKLGDQTLLVAKQHNQVYAVRKQADYIIMDSPILLSPIYDLYQSEAFKTYCLELHNRYDSINFYIDRETEYEAEGRYHTLEESKEVDNKVYNFLIENNIKFHKIGLDQAGEILNIIKTYK